MGAHFMNNLHNTSCGGYLQCINNKKVITSFYVNIRRYSNIQIGIPREISCGEHHSILQSKALKNQFKNWEHLRKNKLTASTFGRAVGFWPKGRVRLFYEKVGIIEPFYGNFSTCWSNIKLVDAFERYMLITGNEVLNPKFQVYGKNLENDWLAASPDGIIYNPKSVSPSFGVLEIKCPYFNGDKSISIPWKRVPMYYIPQVQGYLEIMDLEWMDIYCWTENGSSLFRLYRDVEYWELLNKALDDFWWKHVQPAKEMHNRSMITGSDVDITSLIPTPKHELHRDIVYASKLVADNSILLTREIYGMLQN